MTGRSIRPLLWIFLIGLVAVLLATISLFGFAYAEEKPDSSQILGKVVGTVFNDTNRNGLREAGEPLLAGWTMSLYGSDGATLLGQETTGGSGNYNFGGLSPGKYFVEVKLLGPEWENTTPLKQAVTLLSQNGETFDPLTDFGVAQAALPFAPSPAPASDKPLNQQAQSAEGVLPYTGAESEEKPLRPAILWAGFGLALIVAGLGFLSGQTGHKN